MSVSISYSFSPTTTIASSQVNQNFTDLVNYFNNTACVADMVVGWKGAIVDIPTGWTLDNDLKDKFIVGAGNSYAVGATGGTNTKTIAASNLPQLAVTITDPGHDHNTYTDNNGGSLITSQENESNNQGAANEKTYKTSTNTTGITATANTGGANTALDIRPPYYSLAWLRKT